MEGALHRISEDGRQDKDTTQFTTLWNTHINVDGYESGRRLHQRRWTLERRLQGEPVVVVV
jgi:hypothetical protein